MNFSPVVTDAEQTGNGAPQQQASTARDLFTSSAFSLTVGNAEEGSGGFGALWGRGAVSHFDGREGPLSLTGEVATGMVGIDWISRRWRTGLALAMSRGIGGYSAGVNSGEIESKLTGLFPWVGYDVTDRVSVWATAGYGAGVRDHDARQRRGDDGRAGDEHGGGRGPQRAARAVGNWAASCWHWRRIRA